MTPLRVVVFVLACRDSSWTFGFAILGRKGNYEIFILPPIIMVQLKMGVSPIVATFQI